MIIAQSAVRNVGVVILAVVIIGFLVYLFFNLLDSRGEGGAEIELAANRKPYHDDDVLETTKLDQSLLSGLVLLAIIGIALPLYWLGEPGRQDGLVENTRELRIEDGAESFEEACSSCHGGGATGGEIAFAVTEAGTGEFVASVDWVAPSLTSALTRFDQDEILHTLNFGRNGVMPAWGAPGGGPLTTQELDILVIYLESVQIDAQAVQNAVQRGLIDGARLELASRDPELAAQLQEANFNKARAEQSALPDQISAAEDALGAVQRNLAAEFPDELIEAWLEQISNPLDPEYLTYGELLFSNRADAGAYGCARCHTAGWSFDGANDIDLLGNPLNTVIDEDGNEVPGHNQGGGWFGPNLTGGSTLDQFPATDGQIDFIRQGSEVGAQYGRAGQGSGQMPGFSQRVDTTLSQEIFDEELGQFIETDVVWPASLTEDQIAAIVAYERSL